MKRIKILQIAKFYYPVKGGMETFIYELCNEIKGKFDIKVLVANTKFKTVEDNIEGVRVRRIANLAELASNSMCLTMPYWLKREKADIVHIHLPNPTAVLSYLLVRPKGRLIVHYHSDIIRQKKVLKFYGYFLIYFLKIADVIVATSENYINSSPILSKFKNKCINIHLGINPNQFKYTQQIQKKVNLIKTNYENNIILFVGRLVYYKGVEYLIRAMKKIPATLLIIGTGPMENDLKLLVKSVQLEDRVIFLGKVSQEDLIAYYHGCTIFCLPSIARSEAFGVVQLEAMACGKPVVSTNLQSGVPFVNRHNKTGLIVPPKDPEALANAINLLLGDETLRKEYGKYGKKRVRVKFNMKKIANELMKVYCDVMENHCVYKKYL
ncbi:MAG: glycosyltransferase [Candidatus Marinimicrobia bacterium]|nr:glycosyltransferase [Candidatus Neomarinimicrobiota bacterium]